MKLSICFKEVTNCTRKVEGRVGHVVQIDVCRKRDSKSLQRVGSASDWLNQISHAARPIRSTTQIWVVTRHQYGICALVSQMSFSGESNGSVFSGYTCSGTWWVHNYYYSKQGSLPFLSCIVRSPYSSNADCLKKKKKGTGGKRVSKAFPNSLLL